MLVFLVNSQILDGVLVVSEVVDLAKKKKEECLIFKVDFEKAYDSVSWGFLEYMMNRMRFRVKWIRWIKACVLSGSVPVLVNGCPTKEF